MLTVKQPKRFFWMCAVILFAFTGSGSPGRLFFSTSIAHQPFACVCVFLCFIHFCMRLYCFYLVSGLGSGLEHARAYFFDYLRVSACLNFSYVTIPFNKFLLLGNIWISWHLKQFRVHKWAMITFRRKDVQKKKGTNKIYTLFEAKVTIAWWYQ